MSIITAYNPLPIAFTHGKGAWLYDKNNKRYLDSFSGIAVSGLGHAHPAIVKTIREQAAKVIHTSNMVEIPEQQELARRLIDITKLKEAFFNNSGAEANETAIKLTRLYGHKLGIDNPSIIVMEGAFHGRTMATLTASANRKVRAGFDPLVPGFIRAPYNDIEAIHNIAHNRDDIVAIMLETVQGESGINLANPEFLRDLAAICAKNNWLLVFDEVQTGNGRCGTMYDFMSHGITPDIMTTAKGLGNGVPIGACLMGPKASDLIKPGNHGSTFGGNPLASATALTVLDVIKQDNLLERVRKKGTELKQELERVFNPKPYVTAIRGKGYMLGIEIDRAASELRKIALEKGLLLNIAADKVIRLLPPFIIEDNEIEFLIKNLEESLDEFCG